MLAALRLAQHATLARRRGFTPLLCALSPGVRHPSLRSLDHSPPAARSYEDGFRPQFQIPYELLVVAVGERPATFGVKGVEEHCYFMKARRRWVGAGGGGRWGPGPLGAAGGLVGAACGCQAPPITAV